MEFEKPDALYGIDLGSKYVKVAFNPFLANEGSKILENALNLLFPLMVMDKEHLEFAKSTIFPVRDLLCKKITDVRDLTFYYPMQIERISTPSCGIYNEVSVKIAETNFTIDSIYMMLINWIKRQFEIDKKQHPSCVFSIPIYYTPTQCALLESICNSIGLNNVDFLFDYLASALAFGYENDNSLKGDKYVIILDMGYITTNCTIVKYYKGGMEILSVDYIQYGGRDIDRVIMQLVNDSVFKEFGINLDASEYLYLKSQKVLEAAKEKLSADGADSIKIEIESVKDDDDFEMVLLKEDIEKKLGSTPIENELKSLLKTCYDSAEIPKDYKNTEIVIVGGSLRIPYFQNILLEYLHSISEEKNLTKTLNMDENVAYGCLYFNKIKNGLWNYKCDLPKTKSNRQEFIKSVENNLFNNDERVQHLQVFRNEIEASIYSNDHYLEGRDDLKELKEQSVGQLEELKHSPNINDINFLNELNNKVKELNKTIVSKINFNTNIEEEDDEEGNEKDERDDDDDEDENEKEKVKGKNKMLKINKNLFAKDVKEMEGAVFGVEKQCCKYISLDSEPDDKKKRKREENDEEKKKRGKRN